MFSLRPFVLPWLALPANQGKQAHAPPISVQCTGSQVEAPACPVPTPWEHLQGPKGRLGTGIFWNPCSAFVVRYCMAAGWTSSLLGVPHKLVLVLAALWQSVFGDSSGHLRRMGNDNPKGAFPSTESRHTLASHTLPEPGLEQGSAHSGFRSCPLPCTPRPSMEAAPQMSKHTNLVWGLFIFMGWTLDKGDTSPMDPWAQSEGGRRKEARVPSNKV